MTKEIYDTIIIGAGLAGLTSAIYASRKRMKFLIIAKDFGGQFFSSGEILNYPGIVKTDGLEFSKIMEEQMKFNNVTITEDIVIKITKKDDHFMITTEKNKYETKTVIIATGASPKKLNIPGEEEFFKKGLTYCSVCDGPLFAKKTVAIIGGGNAALEAVDFLKDIAEKIYLVVRGKKFSAHEYLIENISNNKKVEIFFEAETKEVLGDKFVNGIKISQDGEEKILPVKGIIVEIGRSPNTDFLKGFLEMDDALHIIVDCHTQTSVLGIFAAGDCSSGHEFQYVIAAGQGCMALLKAARYLTHLT